ncbi:MAG: hypothetical protein M0Z51_08445, partial [Propionibacterium sp.]|nr:hypothetical protein [Propionibacterium sp.]
MSTAPQATTTAAEVKHQKWWGWGEEGITWSHADKPKFAPFVMDKLGVDVNLPAPGAPPLRSFDVPESRLSTELRSTLNILVGPANV